MKSDNLKRYVQTHRNSYNLEDNEVHDEYKIHKINE